MTARKPPPLPVPPVLTAPKPVPYPPAAIWKEKDEGVNFTFRGNTFARRGKFVTRVVDEAPPEPPTTPTTGG